MKLSENLEKFRKFLETIPLEKYREEFKNVKWVEQDLPNELLPIDSIFKYYWEDKNFLSFEEWFEIFWDNIHRNEKSKEALKKFKSYYFNKSIDENGWFKRGFKARIYRTWISVLTQLDFCYTFEYVNSKLNKSLTIDCDAELDLKGVDARVNNVEFQIKKISHRKEAIRGASKRKNFVQVPYAVFDIRQIEEKANNPRTRNREKYQNMLDTFHRYFEILKNGFVVFSEEYLTLVIENIDDVEKLRKEIQQLHRKLVGEPQ